MFIVPITPMNPVGSLEQAASTEKPQSQGGSFANVLSDAVRTLQETQAQSQQDGYDLAMGSTDNLAALMINSAKAETAMTMAVQLTTRAVNSYKEIMQMQV